MSDQEKAKSRFELAKQLVALEAETIGKGALSPGEYIEVGLVAELAPDRSIGRIYTRVSLQRVGRREGGGVT